MGTAAISLSAGALLEGWDAGKLQVLGIYLLVVNVVSLVLFVADKAIAQHGDARIWRIPEAWLLGLCLVGGSVGGLVGMYAVRHKTRKWYFVVGLPAFLVLDVALLLLAHGSGLV